MCRILNLLAEHPDVQTKLREEIVQARREKGDLGFDDLFNLPYLEAVCRETLRLYVDSSTYSLTSMLMSSPYIPATPRPTSSPNGQPP